MAGTGATGSPISRKGRQPRRAGRVPIIGVVAWLGGLPLTLFSFLLAATSLALLVTYAIRAGDLHGMRFWAQGAPAIGMILAIIDAARKPDSRALAICAFLLWVLAVVAWGVAGAIFGLLSGQSQ